MTHIIVGRAPHPSYARGCTEKSGCSTSRILNDVAYRASCLQISEITRVVRKMRVIFSKMEIQNAKKYPKIFSKNAKYHPKCRKNSFRCHGNQYGHHILDWEVGILRLPVYRRSQTQRLSSEVPLMLRLSSFPRYVCLSPLSILASLAEKYQFRLNYAKSFLKKTQNSAKNAPKCKKIAKCKKTPKIQK